VQAWLVTGPLHISLRPMPISSQIGGRAFMQTRFLTACVTLAVAANAAAAPPDKPAAPEPTYILNGFRLSGVKGINPDDVIAKIKDKEGAKVTEADLKADVQVVGAELKARHIDGQLAATMAEKNGRVWVLFDFFPKKSVPAPPAVHLPK
jgi:hypothetical protein